MLMTWGIRLLALCFIPAISFGQQPLDEMFAALDLAAKIDSKYYECFPTTYNHLLSTGYFTTHSARMESGGAFGFGIAHVHPYVNWNARVQPFSHLEFTLNYRIFKNYEDPVLGPFGFGDHADRGANVKFAVFRPEESLYMLPGLAVGIDDFMGSKKFTTYYVVATQVVREWGVEASLGWGSGRYSDGPTRGFFGGVNWFPFWRVCNKWTRGLGVTAEVDPTNYKKDPHPLGRIARLPINVGTKLVVGRLLELSAGCVRGSAFAASASLHYNWGNTLGLPKIKDPPVYVAPIDTEPLGCFRPEKIMIQELNYALEDQGFQLTRAWIENTTLTLMIMNCRYRQEHVTRMRLQNLLACLTPENITDVVVIIESHGLPCQKYVYSRQLLLRYFDRSLSCYEFDILTPRQNVSPCTLKRDLIFQSRYELWRARVAPRVETFFGNAKGKFKYDAGIKGSLEGFLPRGWFYEFQASYTVLSTVHDISDFDFIQPSQLLHVATDYIRYRQQSSFTWDMVYLQKSWNFGRGCFGRVAGGYFQVNYAGAAAEILWYPARACIALGLEGAVVKKRKYSGFGFQSKLRQFKGREPTYHPYTTLQQYFLNVYVDFPSWCFFTKLSVGQFLARDKGVRLEMTRYFDNGLRLTGWATFTNASDMMHGENYYDRGFAVEIPFDLFFRRSSRRVWNYGMAAWLRDAGYRTTTGKSLFEIINRERRW